jgi:hypothetical protein
VASSGALVFSARPPGRRIAWVLSGSIVVGALAAFASGELELSAGFLLIDVPRVRAPLLSGREVEWLDQRGGDLA